MYEYVCYTWYYMVYVCYVRYGITYVVTMVLERGSDGWGCGEEGENNRLDDIFAVVVATARLTMLGQVKHQMEILNGINFRC